MSSKKEKKDIKKVRGMYRQFHYSYNREYVDYDYINDLTDEEAEWLANFSDNYYSGRFKKDDDKNPIKDRTRCYAEAGQRRRDIMAARSKSRVNIDGVDRDNMEVTDIGIVIESRTGKKK
jgi:hypothetical protein